MSPIISTSDTPFFLSPKPWRTFVVLCLALIFMWGFRDEIKLVWIFFISILKYFVSKPVPIPFDYDTRRALFVVGTNVFVFVASYLIVLFWKAQFTLPVRGLQKRWMSFWRLFLYDLPLVRLHGPAIFVKEGKPIANEEELESVKPGVALVDQYSAIVLEHERGARVRSAGAGVVFTQKGERAIGFVDLRNQFRSRKDVSGSTGDGIEVTTNVSISFTVGQDPEILNVTKINDRWMVIQFKDNQQSGMEIKSLSDELDVDDQQEIDAFYPSIRVWIPGVARQTLPPFAFEAARVEKAVYSRARHAVGGGIGEWTELPLDIAVSIFRNKLSRQLYEELYLPADPDNYPMKTFKADLGNTVRNMGILAYQVVMQTNDQPLQEGKSYMNSGLKSSFPQEFSRSTVLRDRGIKIVSSGFGNLVPRTEVIQKTFLDSWRARWQQEFDKTTAEYELEAMRLRSHERARAQQDMINSLSRIFQTEEYASEALAMRLYQALEMAATQPATQRLLPENTVQMLENLREWLLAEK